MKTSDFYYDLPKELIAQTPVEPRDSSRLLLLDRKSREISHKHFRDVIDSLNEGDLLVCNDSRVLPARIYGIKAETGARVEFLLLKQISGNKWETLCKPGKKAREPKIASFLKKKAEKFWRLKTTVTEWLTLTVTRTSLPLLTKSVKCLFPLILPKN